MARAMLLFLFLAFNGCALSAPDASAAYIFAFPLVLLNVTRWDEPVPANLLWPKRVFPSAAERSVIRPNQDTLYSVAWLSFNLAKQHTLTLKLGDTNGDSGRYYLVPVMDAWTNVITSPGWRTTGKNATVVTLLGPKASRTQVADTDISVSIPTNLAWMLGRTSVKGEKDLPAAHAQQDKYKLDLGPTDGFFTPRSPLGASPPDIVLGMSAETFYNDFMTLMVENPPAPADLPFINSTLEAFGLKPGGKWANLTPDQKQSLTAGMAPAVVSMRQSSFPTVNGWTTWGNTTGYYGTDYLLRARTALKGLGANLATDSMYFGTEGSLPPSMSLHLTSLPPVKAFWSVTAYDVDGYFIPNSLKRYDVGSESDFLVTRSDGSICITAAVDEPKDKTTNWLPTTKANFTSTFRLYWPTDAVLSGQWVPPAWAPGLTC